MLRGTDTKCVHKHKKNRTKKNHMECHKHRELKFDPSYHWVRYCMVFQGTGPPQLSSIHWSCIISTNMQILSASCPWVDFFSGIQRNILLRTKPFLVFYNSSPLASARQWVQSTMNIPSQICAMTASADRSASQIHFWQDFCPGLVTLIKHQWKQQPQRIQKYQVHVVTVI